MSIDVCGGLLWDVGYRGLLGRGLGVYVKYVFGVVISFGSIVCWW